MGGRDLRATDPAGRPMLTERAPLSARPPTPFVRSSSGQTGPAPQPALPPLKEARRGANALRRLEALAQQPRRVTMRPPPCGAPLPSALLLLAVLLAAGQGLPLRKRGPGGHPRMAEVSDERDWRDRAGRAPDDGQVH